MSENLSKKNYAKYDRQFMAFGSLMGALGNSEVLNEKNWQPIANDVWNWCRKSVGEFVEELYEDNVGEKAL